MENKKNKLSQTKRNALSVAIVLISALIMYCDYKVSGNKGSTPFQWIVFIIGLLWILYLQFLYDVPVIEYEEYPGRGNTDSSYPPLEDMQDGDLTEITSQELEVINDTIKKEEQTSEFTINGDSPDWNNLKENEKRVLIVQPMIVVSQEEFNQKTIQMNEEENKRIGLNPATPKPAPLEPVRSFSLHGIHQRRKTMYQDICGFCTQGEAKTMAEIEKKALTWGLQYNYLQPEDRDDLIAFDFGELRIPTQGFFALKPDKEETK